MAATLPSSGVRRAAIGAAGVSPLTARLPSERLRGFRRHPLLYGAMAAYGLGSTGLMLTHRVGLTSEHVILIAVLVVALRPEPVRCGSGCPSCS